MERRVTVRRESQSTVILASALKGRKVDGEKKQQLCIAKAANQTNNEPMKKPRRAAPLKLIIEPMKAWRCNFSVGL